MHNMKRMRIQTPWCVGAVHLFSLREAAAWVPARRRRL